MSKKKVAEVEVLDGEEIVDGEIVDDDFNPDRHRLIEELRLRREESTRVGHIDNSNLYAGSPMYYYCMFCGVHTDTKSENWFLHQPTEVCKDCKVLIELEWHDGETPSFPCSNP